MLCVYAGIVSRRFQIRPMIAKAFRIAGHPGPCVHLGDVIERRGSTCKHLRGCAVHGECTIGGPNYPDEMRCADCEEYEECKPR
jgi:hypothetical protein